MKMLKFLKRTKEILHDIKKKEAKDNSPSDNLWNSLTPTIFVIGYYNLFNYLYSDSKPT